MTELQTPDMDARLTVRDRNGAMHQEIRHRICLLEYAPGTRLSEAALALEFGTSRTPIRRVLAQLEDEGLVQSQHGVGTIVTDANITELAQVYRLRVELTELVGRLDPVTPDAAFVDRFGGLVLRGGEITKSGTAVEFTQFDILDVFCGKESGPSAEDIEIQQGVPHEPVLSVDTTGDLTCGE